MTFKEARKELRRIAEKRYCALVFDETFYSNGKEKTTCRLYVDGLYTGQGGSWDLAFENLAMAMFGKATEEEPEI